MSSGGSSGEVAFPAYMESTHKNWLRGTACSGDQATNSINELLNVSHGVAGNPYEGETAYNPNAEITFVAASPLANINTQFDAMSTIVTAINTAGYFDDFADIDMLDNLSDELANVVTAIDTVLASSTITNLVTAFENSKRPRFLRDMSMWTAGMADINAVNTSSFVIGMGLMQDEFGKSVDAFEAELKSKLYNTVMSEAVSQYLKVNILRLAAKDELYMKGPAVYASMAQLKTEVEKLIILTMSEKSENQLRIDVDEGLWDYETYMYAGNIMSSISGAAAGRKGPTKTQTAVGGAMAGASMGAAFGLPGMAIGAGVGAILSLL